VHNIGIAVREGKEIVEKYIKKQKMTFPVLLDVHGDIEKKIWCPSPSRAFSYKQARRVDWEDIGPKKLGECKEP